MWQAAPSPPTASHEAARAAMTKVTIAPITTTIKGLSSEVLVGPDNGLDHDCAVALDNVITVPVNLLGRTVGLRLLADLRASDRWRDLPVIMFTGVSDKKCESQAQSLGVRAYLQKANFTMQQLIDSIESHLRPTAA